MKKTTFTIVFLLSIIFGFSQSLVTSNKAWSNLKSDYWNPNNLSTENFKFTNDTIINNYVYKKIERSIDENQQNWSFYGFIREDSIKRVFYKLNASEQEYLFYNFTIQLYDTITAYSINTFENYLYVQPQIYFVISVDSVLIGETFRKRINLGIPEDSTYAFEQWIDSTGNIGGLLHNNEMLVGRDSYSLLCFSEDGILKYHHPNYDSCYVLTGLDIKNDVEMKVRISPNPIIERSTLVVENSNRTAKMQIDFYDIMGRKVYSKIFLNELQLTRNEFQPGIYFYKIVDRFGYILIGKIIRVC
ncbi:MAG: T9SS type A sorting domain-containing protein [Bacteroidales bacterium]|nr:T9SS type A sorting domain-containing protein [Bacteroidales bacterium]